MKRRSFCTPRCVKCILIQFDKLLDLKDGVLRFTSINLREVGVGPPLLGHHPVIRSNCSANSFTQDSMTSLANVYIVTISM